MTAPRSMFRWLLPIMILAAAAAGFAWLRDTRPPDPPVSAAVKRWPVAVAPARQGAWQPVLSLLGRVESPAMPTLTAAVAARVESVPAREGATVERGEALVVLEATDYQLLVAQREAELAQVAARLATEAARHAWDLEALEVEAALDGLAATAVTRARDLEARQVGTPAGLDEALAARARQTLELGQRRLAIASHDARTAELRAEQERAGALLERARQDLARTRVAAPFAGRVTAVHVAPGDRVRPGDALVGLYDPARLEVRAEIPTRHQPAVAGAVAGHTPLAGRARIGEHSVALALTRLAGTVAPASGGIDGIFEVAGATAWLPPGQAVTVELELPPRAGTFLLPVGALYGGDKVYVVADDALRGVAVTKVGQVPGGAGGDRLILASEGLADGQPVVVTQLPNAIEGLPVRALGAPTDVEAGAAGGPRVSTLRPGP